MVARPCTFTKISWNGGALKMGEFHPMSGILQLNCIKGGVC